MPRQKAMPGPGVEYLRLRSGLGVGPEAGAGTVMGGVDGQKVSDESKNKASLVALPFLAELPDIKRGLFPQFDTGSCDFGKLPVELRVVIWAMAFPRSKHINLGPGVVKRDIFLHINGPVFILPRIQHPVTLFINSESRYETLRYYRTIYRNVETDLSKPAKLCPLSFDVKRDTFCMQLSDAAASDTDWAGDLMHRNPGCFDGIKKLFIVDRLWSDVYLRLDGYIECHIALRFFKDLEEVVLVVEKQTYEDKSYAAIMAEFASAQVSHVASDMKRFFVRQQEEDENTKIPEVLLIDMGKDDI